MTAKHGAPAPSLKRSFSTATVHTMTQTAGIRKPNKLGYHRTSIACSHCRHRKIRCIVSPELPNRCISCIRLKKDCSFCPVDQQPPADSRGNTTGQGSGSSKAHSQSSSPAPASGNPTGMAARSLHGTGPVQDPVALAPPVVMPFNIGYASVTETIMPTMTEQDFNASPGSSRTWGFAEPSAVTLTGSGDIAYGWHPCDSISGSTGQSLLSSPELATHLACMAASETAHINNWHCNGGIPRTTQARSVSFSNNLIGQLQQQLVSAPNNGLYDGRETNMEKTFTSLMNLASVRGHPPGQIRERNGSWNSQQQEMLP